MLCVRVKIKLNGEIFEPGDIFIFGPMKPK